MGGCEMRRTIVATLVAAFALTGTAQAATVPVQSLTPPFRVSNSSVTKTPDGVHFGVYADAGRTSGSLVYEGVKGQTFGSLTALGYTYNYNTSDNRAVGAPYLRVFLDSTGDGVADADVIFDATLCAKVTPPENTDNVVDVMTQTVRYDDDGCDAGGFQQPFAAVKAAHANEVIVGIAVTQGDSGGLDASAFLRNLTVNGDTFAFNVPPANGQPGAPGTTPTAPAPTAGATCAGDTVRTLRAPRRTGEKFLSVNAAFLTPAGFRSLKTSG